LKIIIKDLVLYGYHGVREQEKKDGQDFVFNISIYINETGLKDNDSLEDTLSYSDVIRKVKNINENQRFELLETLSRTVADKIINMSDIVEKVDVRVEKPQPPIDEKLGSVGVEYSYSRIGGYTGEEDKVTVYISLGSNMGDRKSNIKRALESLERDPGIEVLKTSSFYETGPMYVEDQEDFYNMVAALKVGLDPFSLLGLIKGIEHDMGRKAGEKRYGPRPIDIDILYFGDKEIKSDILEIPHPLLGERKFVLVPLGEIAPEIEIEGMDIKAYLGKKQLPGRVKELLQ
jgi:dihydroneopterin aldolase/2-amino-4-hydroxy-6-hydroxymethyldihydropteridine diphosphokinase